MSIRKLLCKFDYYYKNMNNNSLNKNIFHELWLFLDFLFVFVTDGCSVTNYFVYGFYNMRRGERRNFVTWRRQKWIYKKCNDNAYTHLLRDKDEINEKFKDYLGRDYIFVDRVPFECVLDFMTNNPVFIAKPISGTEGRSVFKFENLTADRKKEVYDELFGRDYMLETYIMQHRAINNMHPSSVNTIRVTTIRNDWGVNIMSASLRMGRHGAVNDNYTTGGLVAAIDLESGVVKAEGVDKMNHRFVFHPDTNQQIVGFKIPFWQDIVRLVNELGTVVPQVRYTGWDIAVTDTGPILLEGNYQGNFHVQQHSDMVGKFDFFKDVIAGIGN